MALGYDGKLFILAFDHRGSFQKKWFGLESEPTDEETQKISDAKHLVFEGLLFALEEGGEASITGALVDEQFGAPTDIPGQARGRGLKLAQIGVFDPCLRETLRDEPVEVGVGGLIDNRPTVGAFQVDDVRA